ncbi:MAG: LPS export ABC transporter permease LptF [Syntrophaceae bacterium]|nr:LPS export ABC transporter permease LptF [Syntrophaceae bacterium]
MTRIINRYILKEIALPFGMILFILTFVLLMGKILQLMDLMINKGVSFPNITLLMLYLLPSFLMFTLPISLLIAILIGLGRLSGDNEITVLKMSGVSLYQLSVPVAVAGLAVFLLTTVTTIFLVPHGSMASKNLIYDMTKQNASIGIREKIFIDDFMGILLYVDKIPLTGDRLEGVLISDRRISSEPSTIIASEAFLISDPDTLAITLRLENGSIHSVENQFQNYRKMDFNIYDIRLDLSPTLSASQQPDGKSSTEMTLGELAGKLKKREGQDTDNREIAIEFNKKFAIPISCLVFALIAIPLGIRGNRSVRSRGFAIGLVLVLIYYLMRLNGEAMAETGRLAPVIGAWAPNFLFLLAGSLLFHHAARERAPWRRLIDAFPNLRRREKGALSSADGKEEKGP